MNRMAPLISIIVPTYNYGHFIEDTLNDLFNQSYQNWECIIVDDGSTDNTKEKVQEFLNRDVRFKYFFQSNKGLSAARNTGIRNSSGEFFQLLDADDKLESNKLSIQSQILVQNPEVGIVYGQVRYFTSENPELRMLGVDGKIKKTWMPEISGQGKEIITHLIQGNIMVVNAPLIRKEVIEQIGYFDDKLRALEDLDYWMRCALSDVKFLFDSSPGTFALVRSHLGSMIKDKSRMFTSNIEYRMKLDKQLKEHQITDDLIELNNKKLEGAKSELICQEISNGRILAGWRESIKKALKSEFPSIYFNTAWKYTKRYYKSKLN